MLNLSSVVYQVLFEIFSGKIIFHNKDCKKKDTDKTNS